MLFRQKIFRSEECRLFDYTGYECRSCGKEFTENDDIVVCPECGTPYHRDCYKKEGRCINDDLHSRHVSWKADNEEKEQSSASLKCVMCGSKLRDDQLFCDNCGAPTEFYLKSNNLERDRNAAGQPASYTGSASQGRTEGGAMENIYPYMINYSDPMCGFNPDEEYADGLTTRDIADYVGTNTHYYLPKFKVMKETGFKLSINFPAMFFPEFYLAYRKMPFAALLVLLINTIIAIPKSVANIASVLNENGLKDMMISMYPDLEEIIIKLAGIDLSGGSLVIMCNICSIISMVIIFIFAAFSNYFYYKSVISKGGKIKKAAVESGMDYSMLLKSSGGTSVGTMILFIILRLFSSYAVMAGILIFI